MYDKIKWRKEVLPVCRLVLGTDYKTFNNCRSHRPRHSIQYFVLNLANQQEPFTGAFNTATTRGRGLTFQLYRLLCESEFTGFFKIIH